MNLVGVTGYVLKDAVPAYTTGNVKKLIFDVMVDNENGVHVPWRCEVHLPHLIERCEPMLTAGRPFIFDAKLDGRLWTDRGVDKGWTRFLRIVRAEFPARTITKHEEPTAA